MKPALSISSDCVCRQRAVAEFAVAACPSCGVRLFALLAALLLVVGTGCGRGGAAGPPATAGGSTRIVSLAPNLTEIICAVGGRDTLVGRTSVCDYPPEVKTVPVVGDFGVPLLERIVAVKPTLVLDVDLWDESAGRGIANLGIPRRRIACRRLEDIPRAMLEVGTCIGRAAAGAQLAAAFCTELARLRASQPPPTERPTVLAVIWHDPVMIAGQDSLITDLVELAGGKNLGDEFAKDYVQVSDEWVITRNPDVILCLFESGHTDPAEVIYRRSGWQTVRAIHDRRVCGGFDLNVMLKPAPRILQSVPALRQCLAGPAK